MEADKIFSQPLVEIQLLGRFRVKIDGAAIDEKRWTRNSAKSLVKLLALKPFHALHREQIMDLLWLEQTPETALNNLNKAVYGARRAFEPNLEKGSASQFLLTEKNQIILASPGSLRVDLDEFERIANYAVQNNDLESGKKALEIYQADLLTEDIYEDWIYTRRETMRILYRKIAAKTAGLYAAENNHQSAIEILKKLAADDASDEYVQRLLMRLYAETGSKYQALKQFQQCRESLHALGIEPETETIKLEQSIKRGEILPIQNPPQTAPIVVPNPRITPLTFQSGSIKSAKFLTDGETAIFTADWNGSPELYTMQLSNGEVRPLGIEKTEVLSVSSDGDLAVMLNPRPFGFYKIGTLAKISADKSAIEILNEIHWADWFPVQNSDDLLAIVRDRNGKNCLEFPINNVIYETDGWIGNPRFSEDGKKIAFIEYQFIGDDRGFVVVYDLEAKSKQILTEIFVAAQGLAWVGDEIWFTAAHRGSGRELKAVNLKGEVRTIYRATGNLTLHDVLKNGKALVTDEKARVKVAARRAVDETERDLSWHDWTLPRDLTDDGETILFEEGGASGGVHFSVYTRKMDGSAVKKIGDGSALALSPDGKYALLRVRNPHNHLVLIPTEAGEIIELENDSANPLEFNVYAAFFPDGKQIMFTATDTHGKQGIYVQKIGGGKPVLFAPAGRGVEMLSAHVISLDGKYVVLTDSEKRLALYQTSNGAHLPLKSMEQGFFLCRWSGDGKNLFIPTDEHKDQTY
ncbi:MAG TPA: BTAD domain-containing putative transcriptional regulator, partial [Pyrinomonadaceae bacterium]|nr:BTAD domain-containing putative transcriptional regulator [Pyrinomonadaceae bacterium]